jgi:hypothetical protein
MKIEKSVAKAAIGVAMLVAGLATVVPQAQAPAQRPRVTEPAARPPAGSYDDDAYLRWRLAPSEQQYAVIDGKQLKQHVREITAISRRYRDAGHQHWGRIMGTESDTENAQWLAEKFRKAGLTDVRIQPIDMPPVWMPDSWEVSATGAGTTVPLGSAEPSSQAATPAGGIELEAVYVGLGTAADFAGRDVKGKAAFITAMPMPGLWTNSSSNYGAQQRAESAGAAAIFTVIALPGNIRFQRGSFASRLPAFFLGNDDGERVRQLIEGAPAGAAPRVKIRYAGKMVSGLKTSNVWGTLPGATDEKIVVVAHRDGYFDAANDNATGVATAVGLAEYFAKVPKDKRRRTIQFVGTPGHHGGAGAAGVKWMADNKDTVFAKTALLINCEHTARVDTMAFGRGPRIREANQAGAFWWYVGGGSALEPIVRNAFAAFGVATWSDADQRPPGEIGGIFEFAPSLQIIEANHYYHTDQETDGTVPATGLEATTRAFAKIIDDVNKADLKDLARRPPSDAAHPRQ